MVLKRKEGESVGWIELRIELPKQMVHCWVFTEQWLDLQGPKKKQGTSNM